MSGDILGTTTLTGLLVTNTPGSAQTNMPAPIAGGPALATIGSGVTFSVQTGARVSMDAGSTLTVASGATIRADTIWVSTLSIGGFNMPTMSSTSSLVAPFVVAGSASSFTIITWAAAQVGDQILVTPLAGAAVSSLSSGLVAHSHCTQAGQVEFRLSNVSTLVQNQSQRSWVFTRIVPSF